MCNVRLHSFKILNSNCGMEPPLLLLSVWMKWNYGRVPREVREPRADFPLKLW